METVEKWWSPVPRIDELLELLIIIFSQGVKILSKSKVNSQEKGVGGQGESCS